MHNAIVSEEKTETIICSRCKQEYPKFKRVTIPNFIHIDESNEYVCMRCKKAELRVCPRCNKKSARFNEKGESAFYPMLKNHEEIEYICAECKSNSNTKKKKNGRWA